MNRSCLLVLSLTALATLTGPSRTEAQVRLDASGVAKRIDIFVEKKLREVKVTAAPRADDAEFLRRVHLDLTGRLPTLEKAAAFLDGKEPERRAKLIDELLASPEFGNHFARYWTELFVKRDGELNSKMKTTEFRAWLAEQFNKGVGWDKIVTKMLTVDDTSPAGFYLRANRLNGDRPSPAKVVGTSAALFLGTQLQCAECHNHPYTREWKQNDFWGLAAFYGRTRYENVANSKTRETRITEEDSPPPDPKAKNKKVVFLPKGGKIDIPDPLDAKKVRATVDAKLLDGSVPKLSETGPHRPHFARWLTDTKNEYFAQAAANRLWAILFARGLVNPLDDLNPKNAPSHPELLALLAEEFRVSGHDVRHVLRSICLSDTYQRTSKRTPTDPEDDNFSRMKVKFLQGEVLLKCLDQVLGVEPVVATKKKRDDTSIGTAELFDTSVYDDNPANYSFGAPQMLRLMNVDVPRRAPAAIARLLQTPAEPAQYLEKLFLQSLARRPTADESKMLLAHVAKAETPARGYEAVVWILLNSAEFVSHR